MFLTGATAASYRRVLGANDRVGVGFIGFGLIGAQHVTTSGISPDVDWRPLPTSTSRASSRAWQPCGGTAKRLRRFPRAARRPKRSEAVVVSTPDHWHALMTMMACAAGKDVYVEKPLTLFVREGRWMTDVARRHKRVVQVGTQQRRGPHYQTGAGADPVGLHRRGRTRSGCGPTATSCRGSARLPTAPRRRELDYDMWLGPAPARPYNPHRAHLPFPLVLGLLRRPDDEPRRARARHRPLGTRSQRADARSRPPAGDSRSRTTARRRTRRTRCSNIRGSPRRGRTARPSGGRRASRGWSSAARRAA